MERWELEKKEKVCALDIDGVLADYPRFWVDYVLRECPSLRKTIEDEAAMNRKPPKLLNAIKNITSYNKYRELKARFRSCGIKKEYPIIHGSRQLLHWLKVDGYTIVLLTARPFDRYKNLFKDTITWLHDNDLLYDAIIWGKDKHVKVLNYVPNLKFMVEDHRYYANLVATWGYPVFLLNNEYNQGDTEALVQRVDCLTHIVELQKEFKESGGE